MNLLKGSMILLALISISFSITGCMEINESGEYELENDLYLGISDGINHLNLPFDVACLLINASNVILDCKGHSIHTDQPSASAITFYAPFFESRENLTIKNCIIRDFNYGIFGNEVVNAKIVNNSITNSHGEELISFYYEYMSFRNLYSTSGIAIHGNKVLLENNSVELSSETGMHLSGYNFNVRNNNVNQNRIGIYLGKLGNSNFSNNKAMENSVYDLSLDSYPLCSITVENMTGSGNRPILFINKKTLISNIELSELILCNAHGSQVSGVTVHGSDKFRNNGILNLYSNNLSFNNVKSFGNLWGFNIYSGSNATIKNSVAFGNVHGIDIGFYSNHSILINNTAYENDWSGFEIVGNNNIITNNIAHDNGNEKFEQGNIESRFSRSAGFGFFIESSGNKITSNKAFGNSVSGFNFYNDRASSNEISGNAAYDNLIGFSFEPWIGPMYGSRRYPAFNIMLNNSAYHNGMGIQSTAIWNFIWSDSRDNGTDWDSESFGLDCLVGPILIMLVILWIAFYLNKH